MPECRSGEMNPLLKGFKVALRPPDRRPPWQWCEEHVEVDQTSPMPGKWKSRNSPWVKELMEVFADNNVTDIAVKCSAQSSKTQTCLNLACWAMSEDSGSAMWVLANKDDAREFVRDRASPTFKLCDPLWKRCTSDETYGFVFGGTPFYFVGAGSTAKLQGKPIRWLFLDEVRNYKKGALETVLKRTRAFWNTRRLIISTPGKEKDAVDRAFKAGDQRVFHVHCPNPQCRQLQPLKFEQLKAEHPETHRVCAWKDVPGSQVEGKWDFDALAPHIRYECCTCGHLIKDNPRERKALARNGKFVRMNPRAPRHRVSFQWNAILPPWVTWRSIVEEFIAARAAARTGDIEPLKTFVNETLGESWHDELGVIEDFGHLNDRKQDYDFDAAWSEERVRFMAADRQASGGEHYWYVIRAFGDFGKSRLIAYGRCTSKLELEEIRKRYNVKVANSVIDSGYEANDVYRFCAATGWKPFKGDPAEFFLHRDEETKKTFRRLWQAVWTKPEGEKKPGAKIKVRLFRHSNPSVKDLIAEYTMGLVGEWTIPKTVGRDYMKQMGADQRVEIQDTKGHVRYEWHQKLKENHLKDCEEMILVAAVITKLIAGRISR